MGVTIKYAALPASDKWLFTQECGDLAFQNMMLMTSFTYGGKNYLIKKRHYDMDDKSWIFLCEEMKDD